MLQHLFLPGVDLQNIDVQPEHEDFLRQWLENTRTQGADGDISASACLCGVLVELLIEKQVVTDWIGLMEEFLTGDSIPIAYSKTFGTRLFKFERQYKQSPVYAIHARWWIEKACGISPAFDYAALIKPLIQTSGWIYNQRDSETRLRNRMRSELMMSQAMGIEILRTHDALDEFQQELIATLADEPTTVFLSAEYFRLQALQLLESLTQAPTQVNLMQVVTGCQVDVEDITSGYCDFSPRLKVADYMGTAHRSARDFAKASPLSGLQARFLAEFLITKNKQVIKHRLTAYSQHLMERPLGIEAFHIRDLTDIPFGVGCTALEVIAASELLQNCKA